MPPLTEFKPRPLSTVPAARARKLATPRAVHERKPKMMDIEKKSIYLINPAGANVPAAASDVPVAVSKKRKAEQDDAPAKVQVTELMKAQNNTRAPSPPPTPEERSLAQRILDTLSKRLRIIGDALYAGISPYIIRPVMETGTMPGGYEKLVFSPILSSPPPTPPTMTPPTPLRTHPSPPPKTSPPATLLPRHLVPVAMPPRSHKRSKGASRAQAPPVRRVRFAATPEYVVAKRQAQLDAPPPKARASRRGLGRSPGIDELVTGPEPEVGEEGPYMMSGAL
ncbi:hypothetical protein P154DRAFT_579049 [Amniculicola lignicola CBS 123094]|uniref:Uncharacterized protein n=1 Tax=Amniculicola lignicola CBS 123094 TaxID=1392246 RepID=A0A6A5W7G9_9PLEO|nr:hypothetical protein P154DRAFT_579049 [Amniculicola lignicola CBS 123094]